MTSKKRPNEGKSRETKEKMILATIDLIEALGLNHVTVRAVAEAAQVNTAAVNYHFGTKSRLIEVALERTLSNMFEDLKEQIQRLPADPESVLRELLDYLMEGSLRFPNITRAHVNEMFVADAKTAPFPTRMATIIRPMAKTVRAQVDGITAEEALHRCVRGISSVFFPVFFRGFFVPSGALLTAEARSRYVDEIAGEMLRGN